MNGAPPDVHAAVVADVTDRWKTGMTPDQLETALESFDPSIPSHPASGTVWSAVAVAWFTLDLQFTGEFKGWVVGLTIAEGPLSGYIYSADFSRLGSSTTNFYYLLGATSTGIVFYDANAVNLGYFVGSTIGAVGAGGGPGQWNSGITPSSQDD